MKNYNETLARLEKLASGGTLEGEECIGFNGMMQVIRHQQEVVERLTKQRDMAVECMKDLASESKDTFAHWPDLELQYKQTLAAIEADGKE